MKIITIAIKSAPLAFAIYATTSVGYNYTVQNSSTDSSSATVKTACINGSLNYSLNRGETKSQNSGACCATEITATNRNKTHSLNVGLVCGDKTFVIRETCAGGVCYGTNFDFKLE